MDGYPDSDEEFELMYGDELEYLKEHEDEINHTPGPKSRKSLEFDTPVHKQKSKLDHQTPSTSKQTIVSDISTPSTSKQVNGFDYQEPSTSVNVTSTQDTSFYKDFTVIESDKETPIKKRGIEDLFGDIDDILNEDCLHKTKKSKTKRDYEEDRKLINHIVETRQLNKNRYNVVSQNEINGNFRRSLGKYNIRENLSYRVPKYPFIVVTRHDKDRIYVRMHSEEYEKEEIKRVAQQSTGEGLLMGTSFSNLIEKAKHYLTKQNEKKQIQEQAIEEDLVHTDNAQMWVDLYKPRKYLELLSDESTNRTLLRWIKLWDKVVFKRRPRIITKKGKKVNEKFKKKELDESLDENDRPKNKIALLCGPPGLGKTTLAHMVARHAGYNVVEINASDDRNIEHFKTALESATQMKSVLDKEKRPNCLVFDEIDGAPAGSIDFLLKFVNGTVKSKKGKKQKPQLLKRPIICICNDVYVPALRPLRQQAFVLNFPPTASSRLAERLCEIARHQHIRTDMGAMTTLSEKSENDIRSCLSVLHFFKTQNKAVTLTEIHRHSVGNKDMNKGLFTTWQELFQIPKPKIDIKIKKDPLLQEQENEAYRTDYISHVVQSFGDYDRLAQGVFENYITITKSHDFPLTGASEGLEWFCFMDLLNTKIHESQNWTLLSYIPYAFVKWNNLFAVSGKPKISYPSQSSEAHTKSQRKIALVAEIIKGMLPSTRPFVSQPILRLEILPFISEIIVPVLRTTNITLFGNCEKEQINNIVNIMIDYSLTYVQERTIDGTYIFNIDPNIDEIVQFEGLKKQRRSLQYSVKQLIAREIELENMRRLEVATKKITNETSNADKNKKEKKEDNKENKEKKEETPAPALPNHLQRLKAKNVTTQLKEVVVKDFFGRVIQKSALSRTGRTISTAPFQNVWFVYKEGYNNAVKRKLKIKQLM